MRAHDHGPTPFTRVTLAGWLATGLILIVSAASPSWGATLVIPALAMWVELVVGGMLTTGAALGLWAPHRAGRIISQQWRLDELGMWLAAGGWAAYTTAALLTAPTALIHWMISLTFCASAITRLATIRAERTKIEAAVERYEREQ